MQEILEDKLHHRLEGGWSITEPKRHHVIRIGTKLCGKYSFMAIFKGYSYQEIATKTVKKTHCLRSGQLFRNDVNKRQGEMVF